jgi:hypothetical protein
MKTKVFISFLLILISFSVSAKDVLVLNNQMTFEGKITKIKGCKVTFRAEGRKYDVPAGEIFMIQFEDTSDKIYNAYLALADNDPEKCMKGQMDAEMYHGKIFGHVALGILFGPFAVIGAAVASPSPRTGTNTYMLSQNRELFSDPAYLMCYQKKARTRNATYAAVGWASWILLVLLYGGAAAQ